VEGGESPTHGYSKLAAEADETADGDFSSDEGRRVRCGICSKRAGGTRALNLKGRSYCT
jgi:hypothetical protein